LSQLWWELGFGTSRVTWTVRPCGASKEVMLAVQERRDLVDAVVNPRPSVPLMAAVVLRQRGRISMSARKSTTGGNGARDMTETATTTTRGL
jgi:hypothetical protein